MDAFWLMLMGVVFGFCMQQWGYYTGYKHGRRDEQERIAERTARQRRFETKGYDQ